MEETTEKKITGKCKQCGQCCKDISLDIKFPNSFKFKELIREDFNKAIEEMVGVHTAKNPYWDFSNIYSIQINKKSIHISGVTCRALEKVGKKYICPIHNQRPEICREYPQSDSIIFKLCGFKKENKE